MQQTEATPRPHSTDRGGGSFLRRLLQTREFGVFLALVALLVVMRFLTPYFWKTTTSSTCCAACPPSASWPLARQ